MRIEQVVQQTAERFDPEKLILLGWHERRTAAKDSDADQPVVRRVQGSRRRRAWQVRGTRSVRIVT